MNMRLSLKQFINNIGIFLIICGSANLSGCGFHIKGNYLVPPELKSLNFTPNDKYSELTRLIKNQLRLNKVTLSDDKNAARLTIINDAMSNMTLSLYPSGNTAEYGMIYTVNFTVALPNGEPRNYSVSVRRDYLDDPNVALAKTKETNMLTREMREQAADRIMQTLASINPDTLALKKTVNPPEALQVIHINNKPIEDAK